MRGTFRRGDIVLVAPVKWQDIVQGDIIAFRCDGYDKTSNVVVHRVARSTPVSVVTRGDTCRSPDPVAVRVECLVGRASFVLRNGHRLPIVGGRLGNVWAFLLRMLERIRPCFRFLYRPVRRSGLLQLLWQPRVLQMHLVTSEGTLIKYIHKQRTVAWWWPESGRFWCRRPYDLVLERPMGTLVGSADPADSSRSCRELFSDTGCKTK